MDFVSREIRKAINSRQEIVIPTEIGALDMFLQTEFERSIITEGQKAKLLSGL